MRPTRFVVPALACLLMAACHPTEPVPPAVTAPAEATPPAPPPPPPLAPPLPGASTPVTAAYGYRCGNLALTAAFHGEGPVDLSFGGKALILPHVSSGSGARYADQDGNAFFSTGTDQAMLSLNDQADLICTGTGPAPTTPAS